MRWRESIGGFTISYGVDGGGLGFFGTILKDGRKAAEYDALRSGYDGLPGLLRVIVHAGVVAADDVAEAARLLPHVEAPDEIDEPAVRFIAQVILNCRRAASD